MPLQPTTTKRPTSVGCASKVSKPSWSAPAERSGDGALGRAEIAGFIGPLTKSTIKRCRASLATALHNVGYADRTPGTDPCEM